MKFIREFQWLHVTLIESYYSYTFISLFCGFFRGNIAIEEPLSFLLDYVYISKVAVAKATKEDTFPQADILYIRRDSALTLLTLPARCDGRLVKVLQLVEQEDYRSVLSISSSVVGGRTSIIRKQHVGI